MCYRVYMWRKEDVIMQLKAKKASSGQSLRAFASSANCSPALMSKVLNGEREPGPKILDELGLEKVVTYQPKKKWRKDE